jgi:hypothetical protein
MTCMTSFTAAISMRRKRDDYSHSDSPATESSSANEELGTLGNISKYIVSLQCYPAGNYNFTLFYESFANALPCILRISPYNLQCGFYGNYYAHNFPLNRT